MSPDGKSQQNPTIAYLLTGALAIVALAACAASFLHPELFAGDNLALTGCARGTALVIMLVAVPAMLISMYLSARGSLRAQMIWAGSVLYILYNSFYFAFSASFNRLFLIYVLMLSLALWSFVAILGQMSVGAIARAFNLKKPLRIAAILFLLLPILIFIPLDVIPHIEGMMTGVRPIGIANTQLPTNHISVIDLAFWTPLFALAAVWLWQRKEWGYALAGTMLTFYTIELFGIGIDQYFGGMADPTSPLADASAMPMFVILSLVWLASLVLYLRNLRQKKSA
ncbi:hypothetical protein [Methanocella sp. MCL-LM]|uniref:hypothetical protein n=1 Tax=Methanocella sp. MCL-LM TaxID=3412035 RepID=UPI003C70E9DA